VSRSGNGRTTTADAHEAAEHCRTLPQSRDGRDCHRIYLILIGIIALIHVAIPGIVTGIIALLAGILILIGR